MELPKRKPNRLHGYSYNQNGAYFITLCVKGKEKLLWDVGATFGRPTNNTYHLSEYGNIINNQIQRIGSVYENMVLIDKYVIMPNHIHIIITLCKDGGHNNGRPQVAPTVSRIIQQFKGSVTKQIGFSIWQKLFYDHIIRNKHEYQLIWEYIDTNPMKWADDCYYK